VTVSAYTRDWRRPMVSAIAAGLVLAAACRPLTPVPAATDARWKPIASTAGAYRLDLKGAPDREGAFVYLLKVPAGLTVPVHTHNGDLTARVRSGRQIITMRRNDGTSDVHTLRPSDTYRIEAGVRHEEQFPDASVIELRGVGPLRTERP